MPQVLTYQLDVENGTQDIKSRQGGELYHDLAFRISGSSPSGTITVIAKKYGSSNFESIPDGTIDLSSPVSILFTGGVAEYRFVISGVSGISSIYVTDVIQEA